jgi:DNA-binding LacI/PurR family transcriptional regulator
MSKLHISSGGEQVAAYLRAGLSSGRWRGVMPGKNRLARELGVGNKIVVTALAQLEREGLLVGLGPRRRRQVADRSAAGMALRRLRVAILLYEPMALTDGFMIELQHTLAEEGHTAFFAEDCLTGLGMKVPRIQRLVRMTEADAWVVNAASREVLAWFAAQPVPTFALFGRRRGLPIASIGPDKPPAYAAATRHLIGLGHRRIVLLCRRMRRMPVPGAAERAFLGALEAHGITPGTYHLPDWEESIDGFHDRLASVFRVTPPTAMIVDEATFFYAVLQFLAGRGIRVPDDLSLVCTDDDRVFAWSKPSVAHIRWDSRPVLRRIVRWTANVCKGKEDTRQTLTKTKFVVGGTVGPVRGSQGRPSACFRC